MMSPSSSSSSSTSSTTDADDDVFDSRGMGRSTTTRGRGGGARGGRGRGGGGGGVGWGNSGGGRAMTKKSKGQFWLSGEAVTYTYKLEPNLCIPLIASIALLGHQLRVVNDRLRPLVMHHYGRCRGIVLNAFMGTGKTLMLIATSMFIRIMIDLPPLRSCNLSPEIAKRVPQCFAIISAPGFKRANSHGTSIVVVPRSIMVQWRDEFYKFVGSMARVLMFHGDFMTPKDAFNNLTYTEMCTYDYILTTPDVLSNTFRKQNIQEAHKLQAGKGYFRSSRLAPDWEARVHSFKGPRLLFECEFGSMSMDEAENLGSCDTDRWKSHIAVKCLYYVSASGTPISNSPKNLYAIMRASGLQGMDNEAVWTHEIYNRLRLNEHVIPVKQSETGIKLPDLHIMGTLLSLNKTVPVSSSSSSSVHRSGPIVHTERSIYNLLRKISENVGSHNQLKILIKERQCAIAPVLLAWSTKTKTAAKASKSDSGSDNSGSDDDDDDDEDDYDKCVSRASTAVLKRGSLIFQDPFQGMIHNATLQHEWNDALEALKDVDGPLGIGATKIQEAIKILEQLLKTKQKGILFCTLEQPLMLLEYAMKKRGYGDNVIRYSATATALKKDNVLHDFKHKNNIALLFITYKCGGRGFNFVHASVTVKLDVWWNPNDDDQSTCRVRRLGQQAKLLWDIHLIAKNTVDERILQKSFKKCKKSDEWLKGDRSIQSAHGKILIQLNEERKKAKAAGTLDPDDDNPKAYKDDEDGNDEDEEKDDALDHALNEESKYNDDGFHTPAPSLQATPLHLKPKRVTGASLRRKAAAEALARGEAPPSTGSRAAAWVQSPTATGIASPAVARTGGSGGGGGAFVDHKYSVQDDTEDDYKQHRTYNRLKLFERQPPGIASLSAATGALSLNASSSSPYPSRTAIASLPVLQTLASSSASAAAPQSSWTMYPMPVPSHNTSSTVANTPAPSWPTAPSSSSSIPSAYTSW